ncbi:MAG: hypothetical protein JW889_08615, partial [Verrucomicrobia bacterium]|nr:hypothetical protein [Verrucomicrobiota bacterium]
MAEKRRGNEENAEEASAERARLLTGKQKAAILLVVLGTSKAAKVFRHLEDSEVEKIIGSLAEIRSVAPASQETVLEEALAGAYKSGTTAAGGMGFAKKVLEEALGARKAADIINR